MESRERLGVVREMLRVGLGTLAEDPVKANAIRQFEMYRLICGVYQMTEQRLDLQNKIRYALITLLSIATFTSMVTMGVFYYFGEITIAMSFFGPLAVSIGGLVLALVLRRRASG